MSIPVALPELAKTLADYRFAYLLTVAEQGGPHTVAVTPVLDGGALVVRDVGRRTRTNAAVRSAVTLVWPPDVAGGYSLIVDGEAELDGDAVRVRPGRAVLHRPAPAPEGTKAEGCTSDCVELPLPAQ